MKENQVIVVEATNQLAKEGDKKSYAWKINVKLDVDDETLIAEVIEKYVAILINRLIGKAHKEDGDSARAELQKWEQEGLALSEVFADLAQLNNGRARLTPEQKIAADLQKMVAKGEKTKDEALQEFAKLLG